MKSLLSLCLVAVAIANVAQTATAECRHARNYSTYPSGWSTPAPRTYYTVPQPPRPPQPSYSSTPRYTVPTPAPRYETLPFYEPHPTPRRTAPRSQGSMQGYGQITPAGSSSRDSEAIINGRIVTFRNGQIIGSRPYYGR